MAKVAVFGLASGVWCCFCENLRDLRETFFPRISLMKTQISRK